MLDLADVVAINKFDRRGGDDALRDVRRQFARDRELFGVDPEELPVFGTIASRFNDDGVTALYQHLRSVLAEQGLPVEARAARRRRRAGILGHARVVVPPDRSRYLAEIAGAVRDHHAETQRLADVVRAAQRLDLVRRPPGPRRPRRRCPARRGRGRPPRGARRPAVRHRALARRRRAAPQRRPGPTVALGHAGAAGRGADLRRRRRPRHVPAVGEPARAASRSPPACSRSSATTRTPPACSPARATPSAPTAASTCSRPDMPATRLSTAFDSVTLYGFDPAERPDIYGKVGNAGVSICTLDDMKALYDGFDLCDPTTSVSMTINGPAPTILAMFLNTVIDQQLDRFEADHGRRPTDGRGRRRPGRGAAHGARHGAGRRAQGGPGPEHLHPLHRVRAPADGRRAGVVRRQPGAELLLGVDLRLPHRRSGREPHLPAGVHPRQRLHLRRVVPGPGHGGRRLRPQPLVLLQQRDGPRVHGARPGRPTHLGGGHARALRRRRALAEAQVPRADLGPVAARPGDGLQRHPHHAAGPHRRLRQLQQPPHQRLRRGRHHPDRGSRCAGRWRSS